MSTLPCQPVGIDAPNTRVFAHSTPILTSYTLITRAAPFMRKLFPELNRDLAFKSYCILCYISVSPKQARTKISEVTGFHKKTVNRVAALLINKGLIREIASPRLIVPFQAYRIDKVLKIAPKGEKILKKLFDNSI